MKAPPIITCPQWGARPPKAPPIIVPRAVRFILHGTAGHVHQLSDPLITTQREAMQYARDIQAFHMDTRGWNDTGQNALVCRAGFLLQGRWLTVSSIEAGHMVESAHCPGQNGEIGIELEHDGKEEPTDAQLELTSRFMAWASHCYKRNRSLPMFPHHKFVNTECPVNLERYIPSLERRAQILLDSGGV